MDEYRLDLELNASIDEIVLATQNPLNKDIVEKWLADYYDAWEIMKWRNAYSQSINYVGGLMYRFERIWNYLEKLSEYFRIEAKCEIAMNEYYSIMAENSYVHNNVALDLWLLKFENIGREELMLPPMQNNDVNKVNTIDSIHYVVYGDSLKNSIEFYKVFNNLFWEEQLLRDRIFFIKRQRAIEGRKLRRKR